MGKQQQQQSKRSRKPRGHRMCPECGQFKSKDDFEWAFSLLMCGECRARVGRERAEIERKREQERAKLAHNERRWRECIAMVNEYQVGACCDVCERWHVYYLLPRERQDLLHTAHWMHESVNVQPWQPTKTRYGHLEEDDVALLASFVNRWPFRHVACMDQPPTRLRPS